MINEELSIWIVDLLLDTCNTPSICIRILVEKGIDLLVFLERGQLC